MAEIPRKIKRLVFERAYGCCEYCRSQALYSSAPFCMDHIVPSVKGGSDEPDNLALACLGCNGSKSTKSAGHDPVSEKQAPLFNPRKQEWSSHFAWSADFLFIIGLTVSGRATVYELKMNRAGSVNNRRAVKAVGDHPPVFKK